MSQAHLIGNTHALIHGHRRDGKRSSEYRAWLAMRQRCLDPNTAYYPRYGGRGILICSRWDSFENFLADMGPRPSAKHELDRYPDKNGNYEPGNCRWATRRQQARNRRNNRTISFNGKTMCLAEWSQQTGIHRAVIAWRLKDGWSVERALTAPVRPY